MYYESKLEQKDKTFAFQLEKLYEEDDTLGHRKIGKLLKANKKKARRIMKKYGILARRKKKRYEYPGRAHERYPNLLRNDPERALMSEVIFSDMFELKLLDGSKVRGCFALRLKTRQILSLVFDYSMKSSLVVETIQRIDARDLEQKIWHTDQGKQYGASVTTSELLRKGFEISMSRAGTPTDNGYAERFVGIFKLSVVHRRRYESLGDFLKTAERWINFYNEKRPHEGVGQLAPNAYAEKIGSKKLDKITL